MCVLGLAINSLQQFANSLNGNSWPDAAVFLKVLIEYQVFCGFWDRGPRQLYSLTRLRREKVLKEIETRQRQVLATVADARGMMTQLRETVGAIKAAKDEVAEATGGIRKTAEEVGTLLAKSSGHNGRLEEMVNTEQARVEQADLHLKSATEGLSAVTTKANELGTLLAESEKRITNIKEKEALVNEIAGTAAAGLLGQKFEARRKELGRVCNWWLVGLTLALVVSAAWLWATHKYFHIDGVVFWEQLASNFGLMLPALFLVLFVAAQYLKERNFQEEYAFRASVAMTLKAFADEMVTGNAERNQVLRETVARLYQMPNGLLAKEDENPASVSKAVTEFLKGTTELVKEVKK